MAYLYQMLRFEIEFEDRSQANEKNVKLYKLCNTPDNYQEILKWCKKLNLLPSKDIRDIEINKINNCNQFKTLLDIIQEKLNLPNYQKAKIIFDNVLTNIMLSEGDNLIEFTDELIPDGHLKTYEVQTTTNMCEVKSVVPVYSMRTKNRGVLFFVNMREFPNYPLSARDGSQYDKYYMISLFQKLGYKIYYFENLLLSSFWNLVNRLIKFHLDETESLVFLVASHGNEKNDIEFYFGESANIFDILFKFNDQDCPNMKGKPKVFIFPCCRGATRDYGVERYKTIESDGITNFQPTYSDILICYGTIHGYVTNRDIDFGSWYIEAFYSVLAQKSHELDIESMLYIVNETVEQICKHSMEAMKKKYPGHKEYFQTPSCVKWDFNKLLFFNPGYVEESDDIVNNQS